MSIEFDAKVFKSGNSLAIRVPKALGLRVGDRLHIREQNGVLVTELPTSAERRINLSGVYGSIPHLERLPADPRERDWNVGRDFV